jgi:ABC-type amino acid transport substrate-binding protein/ABC-type amino acid transport system permease subunit
MRQRTIRFCLIAGLIGVAAFTAAATSVAADRTLDAALAELLDAARSEAAAPGGCRGQGLDGLVRVICEGRIRVGVRSAYPLFATRSGGARQGYEIDVARSIAARLGVAVDFVTVKAQTRIPMLADGSIDLVIATMGHTTERDGQVRFVRPHYYRSRTLLVGPRDLPVSTWRDIQGLTVCVTVGNGSNAELVSRGARLMLFDNAQVLLERLADGSCTLAAQDDRFFAFYLNDPAFAARFSVKFGFAPMPWGMAVARQGSDRLARALELVSRIFHRDGVFLTAARANHIATEFLAERHAIWRSPECLQNWDSEACLLPPFNAALQPTAFAGRINAIEAWLRRVVGIEISLPMLETAPAWSLFLSGAVNSLAAIAGTLPATLCCAVLFGVAMSSRLPPLRWAARGATIALQSSPILLTLVIAATIVRSLFGYSSTLALAAAILALGLANGANAGQAIAEAYQTLRAESPGPVEGAELLSRALTRSATQIVAFLINAAKGTPIASFIGAPELLNTLTDITSFSSGRAMSYTLLLVFYTAVVMAVVWLCRRFQALLERRQALA